MGADLESRLRELPARLESVHAPADLAEVVRGRHRRHRRLRMVTAAAAATAVLAGTTVLVGVRDREPAPTVTPAAPRGPAPADPRLLPWPTRGPLAGDAEAVRTARQAAAQVSRNPRDTSPSARPPHLLWIGRVGDGTRVDDGVVDRLAVTQEYPAGRPGIELQWLIGSATNRWHSRAVFRVDPGIAGTSLHWWVGPGCPTSASPCADQYIGLLVLGAPDVESVQYRFPGGQTRQAAVTDGVALAMERINRDTGVVGLVYADVVVTRRGGRPESVQTGVPALIEPRPPEAAVEWHPTRGLPPLLDAPETFPGLDLWGRLHGLPGRPGYANPVWGGTLADGSRAVVAQPMTGTGTPKHLVFAVNPPPAGDTSDTFLVRDLANPPYPDRVAQVSAYLPLSDGRCQLVVVGKPGTTAVRYAEDGRAFTDLPVRDGVGTLVLPSCDGHERARLSVRRGGSETYAGPVDSTRPGAGVKRG